jgi:hypothetical protein
VSVVLPLVESADSAAGAADPADAFAAPTGHATLL